MQIPTDRFTKKIDQGENTYSFRLGVYDRENLETAAQEFARKPYALNVFPTSNGTKKSEDFAVSLSDTSIALVAMKKRDGRDAVILRLLNNSPSAKRVTLSVESADIDLAFGKYEVKTVVYENCALYESELLII